MGCGGSIPATSEPLFMFRVRLIGALNLYEGSAGDVGGKADASEDTFVTI